MDKFKDESILKTLKKEFYKMTDDSKTKNKQVTLDLPGMLIPVNIDNVSQKISDFLAVLHSDSKVGGGTVGEDLVAVIALSSYLCYALVQKLIPGLPNDEAEAKNDFINLLLNADELMGQLKLNGLQVDHKCDNCPSTTEDAENEKTD